MRLVSKVWGSTKERQRAVIKPRLRGGEGGDRRKEREGGRKGEREERDRDGGREKKRESESHYNIMHVHPVSRYTAVSVNPLSETTGGYPGSNSLIKAAVPHQASCRTP